MATVNKVVVSDGEQCLFLGRTNIPRNPPQSSRYQKADMRQVPYYGPTNIRHHHIKFSHLGYVNLWPIYSPKQQHVSENKNVLIQMHSHTGLKKYIC